MLQLMQVCYAARGRLVSGTELEREGFVITAEEPARTGTDPHPSDFLLHTRLAVVGAGRLGTAVALALQSLGGRLVAFTCRSEEGRRRAQDALGIASSKNLADLLQARPTLILLTVPDAALAQAATDLAAEFARYENASGRRLEEPALIVHTSGATPVDVLAPLAELGHATLALHPLQTFAESVSGARKLAGSAFAVTPGPLASYEQGARLAEALGGLPFPLSEQDRPLYHAAAVFASNYLVTLAYLAERLARCAGMPEKKALAGLLPLMQGALDNLAERGSLQALTGPLSRGDESTVRGHLEALGESQADVLPVYQALARATLELVALRAEVPGDTLTRLNALLSPATPAGPASGGRFDPSPGGERNHGIPEEAKMNPAATSPGYIATGNLSVLTHSFTVTTQGEADIHNITEEVRRLLGTSGLDSGTATVFVPGATGGVTTLEFEPGVVHDFKRLFDQVAGREQPYEHNVTLGDGNGHSHVRAGLLGPSLVVPFAGNRLILGTWQEICVVCFDNRPRERKVVVQLMGVGER